MVKPGNRYIRRENCHIATLSAKNIVGTDLGSNPGFRGETPTATLLNHGTVKRPDFTCDMCKDLVRTAQ